MYAFLTGSGFYDFHGFEPRRVTNRFGEARLLAGEVGGHPALVLPRHGANHRNLPHQINHRANLLALREAGATAVVSLSICGIMNPDWPLATPLLARDLFFPANRLGDGATCTIFDQPGEPGRGHLLPASFFHPALTDHLGHHLEAVSARTPLPGCYASVDGPRFNSRAEIRFLRAAGADFLSQTCGPEAVLANELEMPYALAGFGVDYANGVHPEPTPVEELQENLAKGGAVFTDLVAAVVRAGPPDFPFGNLVYRFD